MDVTGETEPGAGGHHGSVIDRLILFSRERPGVVAIAVVGWMLALSLLEAYYVSSMEPIGPAAPFWFFAATWFVAGLVTGRFWAMLLALLPTLVMGALGTSPLYGSSDMPQWTYALMGGILVLAPLTLVGVIAHKCIAGLRGH